MAFRARAPRSPGPALLGAAILLVLLGGFGLHAERDAGADTPSLTPSTTAFAPRRGGKVRRAWPRKKSGRRPRGRLKKWLAKQVGARRGGRPTQRRIMALGRDRHGDLLLYAAAETTGPLQLVRSFDIPLDDPDYDRLTNFSWTYDSALAAMAFTLGGDKPQADQLLSQLAALQRADGAIEYVYDSSNGDFVPLHRAGTMSLVGLAGAQYRKTYRSRRYDPMTMLTAEWLLARQELDPEHPAYGLLYGGPDVDWISTQHNILAYLFLRRFAGIAAEEEDGIIPIFECVLDDGAGGLHAVFGYENHNAFQVTVPHSAANHISPTPLDGPQPTVFEPGRHYAVFTVPFGEANQGNVVWHVTQRKDVAKQRGPACDEGLVVGLPPSGRSLTDLANAAELIARGIDRTLLLATPGGWHFIQGFDDQVLPLDVQALGVLFLLDRGDAERARHVRDYLLQHYLAVGRDVAMSVDPATYNMTWEAPGPFMAFRPYADASAPDVVWMEGTGEARLAISELAGATTALDTSVERWRQVTEPARAGLLGADRTVFDPDFNEYHVWPTSAASSWYLLSHADPSVMLLTTQP
jgi:hypothetical protein